MFGALLHLGYHALTKPVLFFAAGNLHQHYHTLDFRRIGRGVGRVLPGTALVLTLAAIAVSGLPPFGLFVSELTIVAGSFKGGAAWAGAVMLAALLVVFCGMLSKLSGLLLGPPPPEARPDATPALHVLVTAGPLVALLVFSLWLPAPVRQLLEQAAGIIGGTP